MTTTPKTNSAFLSYETKKNQLICNLKQLPDMKPRLQKKSASNLFRYIYQKKSKSGVDIKNFDHILSINTDENTLDVEGMTTYDTIVKYSLQC